MHMVCVSMCTTCMQYPQRPEEGVCPSGSGVTEGCKSLPGCWKPKLDPLEDQLMLFTAGLSPSHVVTFFVTTQTHPTALVNGHMRH